MTNYPILHKRILINVPNYLVVGIDDKDRIVGVDSRRTEGLAHQLALKVSDAGYRVRIVSPEDAKDGEFLWDQVKQKRDFGFIEEYGIIPNGNRTRGEGARGIGRMIYEPLGIKVEERSIEPSDVRAKDTNGDASVPPPLSSSTNFEKPEQKIVLHSSKYIIKIGGRQFG